MNPAFFQTNQRVADALFNSVDADYYSSDGETWDPYADTVYFNETTAKYNASLLKEAAEKELKAESLDDLSPALSEFILRVEKRVAERASSPLERNYKTNIGYTYEDPKSGKKVRGYLDIKNASDADLQSIIDDVPEARLELMYRAITQVNSNNTNE
jgi:hypothetical protein